MVYGRSAPKRQPKTPDMPSSELAVGTRRTGRDHKQWAVVEDATGRHSWRLAPGETKGKGKIGEGLPPIYNKKGENMRAMKANKLRNAVKNMGKDVVGLKKEDLIMYLKEHGV